jgi:hypothetical protein
MTQIYQIRVRGHLSDVWAEWFDGLFALALAILQKGGE